MNRVIPSSQGTARQKNIASTPEEHIDITSHYYANNIFFFIIYSITIIMPIAIQ